MSSQGKWIIKDYTTTMPDGTNVTVIDRGNYKCSICGGYAGIPIDYIGHTIVHILKYPYCPWCGAKMANGTKKNGK